MTANHPSPRRRLLRNLIASTMVLLVVAAPVTAAPRPRQQAASTTRGTIRLIQQTPMVAADGDFTAFFEVSDVPAGSDIAVDIYPVLDSEQKLQDALKGTPRNSEATFPVIDLPGDPDLAPVQTGFVINLSGRGQPTRPGGFAKRLVDPGVYPVRVRLRGPTNTVLQTLVTYLVRLPATDEEVTTADVAVLALVEDGATALSSLQTPEAPPNPERLDAIDSLADTLTAHPDISATLEVEPSLLRRLAASAGEAAEVAPAEPTTSVGDEVTEPADPDQPDAAAVADRSRATLDRLLQVLEGDDRDLMNSPYVQIDPTRLVAAGLDGELARQQNLGFRDLAQILEPPTGQSMLVSGGLTSNTARALGELGVTELLVHPSTIDGSTPGRPARIAGAGNGSRATVVTPQLRLGRADDPALAAQATFAQLVARASISDGAPQIVTVPLPETLSDITELDAVLELLSETNPFLSTTTLSRALERSSTDPIRVELATTTPAAMGDYPSKLTEAASLVASYSSTLPDRPDLVGVLDEQLARTATEGLTASQRLNKVEEVRAGIETRFASISIPASDRVSLGTRHAQFPLVIRSGGDVTMTVVVEVSSKSDRLTVVNPRNEVLLEGDRTVVPIEVESRSPGDTPLRVTISTPDGNVVLATGTYSVRSTAVSGVGVLLTVGAGLFLALWWGRHWVRSRRSRGRHAR